MISWRTSRGYIFFYSKWKGQGQFKDTEPSFPTKLYIILFVFQQKIRDRLRLLKINYE